VGIEHLFRSNTVAVAIYYFLSMNVVGENFYILLSNIQDLILQNNIINTNTNTFVVDEISIEYLTIAP
jgi:hypothetical protein